MEEKIQKLIKLPIHLARGYSQGINQLQKKKIITKLKPLVN